MKKSTKKVVLACTMATMMLSFAACGSSTDTTSEDSNATVYTGTGNGNGGDIVADVTVEDGVITNIEITADSETTGICETPIEEIPAAIIEAQSTDVDVVSGATNTSNGIIEAVNAALTEAGLN